MRIISFFLLIISAVALIYCSSSEIEDYTEIKEMPDIFPNYRDITIPCNIAPLNFRFNDEGKNGLLKVKGANNSLTLFSKNGCFFIPKKKWREILQENKGGKIDISIFENDENSWKKYCPFSIFVSKDSIDSYLAYRLIEPGYKLWFRMGIYQRKIESFDETAIYENKTKENTCMNCHSFCMQNPDEMLFHVRGKNGGTMLIKNNEIEKLNTKTDKTISNLVYPCWHPEGRFVAFSVNNTKQVFYLHNRNRIEVFDFKSDVIVYDTQEHQIFTSPLLSDKERFETFPGFSADGKTLFFCTAKNNDVPAKSDSVKYSLCSISFDAENKSFGIQADTVFNADLQNKSVAFPRVSPNGNYLLFTVADYGCFPIWHKEADLYLYDLEKKKYVNMDNANSNDVDSYHSWSSNSKWFIFSSRRGDGLYTRLYIAHVDEKGNVSKAFLLPQKDPYFYDEFMKSYNIPELITGKVVVGAYNISKTIEDKDIPVRFKN